MDIRRLVGSGDRIGLFVLPVVVIGLALNVLSPAWFAVGGPPDWLRLVSIGILAVGIVGWAWSAVLILLKVPRGELITGGPYALVRHPLYTAVALLVLPWLGFLLNSWLGIVLGAALYLASRRFSPAEEADLAARFGSRWDAYRARVLLPWL